MNNTTEHPSTSAVGKPKSSKPVNPPSLTLWFDGGEIPKLIGTKFKLSQSSPEITASKSTCKWRKGTKALSIFLLEYWLWEKSPEEFAWEGKRKSAVTSLYDALGKHTNCWPFDIFGPKERAGGELSHLYGFLTRHNPSPMDGRPMYLMVNSNLFPQSSIHVIWQNATLTDRQALKDLLAKIQVQKELAWHRSMAKVADKAALSVEAPAMFSASDIVSLDSLVARLVANKDGVTKLLNKQIKKSAAIRREFARQKDRHRRGYSNNLRTIFVGILNDILEGPSIINAIAVPATQLRRETRELREKNPKGDDLIRFHRLLLEDALCLELRGNPRRELAQGSTRHHRFVCDIHDLLTKMDERRAASEKKILEWSHASADDAGTLQSAIVMLHEAIERQEQLEESEYDLRDLENFSVRSVILRLPGCEIKPFLALCCGPSEGGPTQECQKNIQCDADFYDAIAERISLEATSVLIDLFRAGNFALPESVKKEVALGYCRDEKRRNFLASLLVKFRWDVPLFQEWLGTCSPYFPEEFLEEIINNWMAEDQCQRLPDAGNSILRTHRAEELNSKLKELPEDQFAGAVRTIAAYYSKDMAKRLVWLLDNGGENVVREFGELMAEAEVDAARWPQRLKEVLAQTKPNIDARTKT